jgi:tetratricopeptide (TPR) repeat protein
MNSKTAHVLLFALLVAVPTAFGAVQDAPAQGSAVLETELTEVRRLLQAGKWKEARGKLVESLEAHEGRTYVLAAWAEIEEALARCRFWSAYKVPKPKEVVPCKLLSWKPSSGAIKLRYTKEHRLKSNSDGDPAAFIEVNDDLYIHPLLFTGPYTIVLKGKSLSARKVPTVFVEFNWGGKVGTGYTLRFDENSLALGFQDGGFTLIDSNTVMLKYGRPFEFKASVTSSTITASYNGNRLLRFKNENDSYGQFGLFDLGYHDTIEITGKVDPAWVSALVDARVQRDWSDFRQSFDARKEVPGWLAEKVAGEGLRALDFGRNWPMEPTESDASVRQEALRLYEKGRLIKGVRYARDLAESEASEVLRDWLLAFFLAERGKLEESLPHLERVMTLAPDYYECRHLHTLVVRVLSETATTRDTLEALTQDFPDRVDGWELLADHLLVHGSRDETRGMLISAIEARVPPQALNAIGTTLLRAKHGPPFHDRSEYRSTNFVVTSDLSNTKCGQVAAELERSLRRYNSHFRRVKADKDAPKFAVFLFSGNAGYSAYCDELIGNPAESTLGLYSSVLKQLLLWNSPDPKMFKRTVRHEGFHQYFDRLVGDSPLWLNEGLAEYYEQAHYEGRRWKDDQLNQEHLALLRGGNVKWTKLKDFVFGSRPEFQSDMGLHYPQAWALVHYLRNEGRESRKRFNTLIAALIEGEGNREALERAFGDVDWEAFEADFRRYVLQLER